MDEGQKILQRFKDAKQVRALYDNTFREIEFYFSPRRAGNFSNKANQFPEASDLLSSVAPQVLMHLVNTLQGGMCNRNLNWMEYARPTELESDGDSAIDMEMDKLLYSWTQDNLRRKADPRSRYYRTFRETLQECITFGTGLSYMYYDPSVKIIKMKSVPLYRSYIITDFEGNIQMFYEEIYAQVQEFVRKFGIDSVSKQMREAFADDPFQKVTVIMALEPNDDYLMGKTDVYNTSEMYVEEATGHVISKKGIDYLPVSPAYWDTQPNFPYGSSITFDTLGDVITVNAMEETALRIQQYASDPTMLTPDTGTIPILDLDPGGQIPGGLNDSTGRPRVVPLEKGGRPDLIKVFIEAKEEGLRRAFFNNDLFLQDRPQMTAEEVIALKEETFRTLNPSIERILEYLHDVESKWLFLSKKHGLLPEPKTKKLKEAVEDLDIEIKFDSPLANTTKSQDYLAVRSFLNEIVVPLANIDPTVLDTLNFERLMYGAAFNRNVPLQSLANDEELEDKKTARAEQQAAAFELQAQQALATQPTGGGNTGEL